MKRSRDMKNHLMKGLLLGALSLAAGSAGAIDYNLCAGETTKTMPDGSTVAMWGYALGGADAGACVNAPTFPGPRLTVPDTDMTLTINLTNTLPEPTSIVIPGQALPAGGPTWDDGTTGARNPLADPPQRVRSFGAETAAGATASSAYTWTGVQPGTFLYHSGTHPQKQVYMGLYGAVTKDAVAADTLADTPAEAYPGVEYFNEIVLFYSEIDPDLNASIAELYNATGTVDPYATSIDYHPRWFLVNGEPYSTACTDNVGGFDVASGYPCANMVQTGDITTGTGDVSLVANQKTLLRFLSTAGETHVPVLQGMHMTLHAEDGNQYNWQDGDTVMATAPREQYSVMMPPLKTKDAIIQAPADGRYAVYDGNGYMTNPTSPDMTDVGDPVGGMLRFLAFAGASNQTPVANAGVDQSGVTGAPVSFDGSGSTDDGTIVSYDWNFGDGTVVPDAGATPSHAYTTASAPGTPYTVTLTVTDDGGLFASAATTATIALNTAPVADPNGPYTGSVGTPVAFDGSGSTDDSNIVSYAWDFGDTNTGSGATPSHTYATAGTYNVALTVTDDSGAFNTSATTPATIAANLLPIADPNGPYSGSTGVPVTFDGTGSIDPDGTVVGYAWDFGDGNIGSGPTPSNTYADAGTYTVTLTVTDNAGGISAPVTAPATISAANQPPVADAGGPYSASMIFDSGTVTFDGSGSDDPDGTIASWEWDFGDGNTGSGETAIHTYTAPSTYVVTLTVTDDGATPLSATDTAIASIVANQAPVAVDDTAAVPRGNNNTTFVDLTSNDWDFEDGTVVPDSVDVTSGPARGTAIAVVIGGVGGVNYTPQGGSTGTVFLTYTVMDLNGAVSNEATVTINVIR